MIKKIRHFICTKSYGFYLSFFVVFILSSLFLSFTNDFRDTCLASAVYGNGFKNINPIDSYFLRIDNKNKKPVDEKIFPWMFKNFYYNLNNFGVREYVSKPVAIQNLGIDIMLNTQETFSVREEESTESGYYVDFGLFVAYYPHSDLGFNPVSKRFGCSSFIFISDTIADLLVSYYGIEQKSDCYKELILNKEYAVLNISIDSTPYQFCINNIIYSSKRSGPRMTKFNNYFATAYLNFIDNSSVDMSFEIDLKPSSFAIRQVLRHCEEIGCDRNNYSFSFYNSPNEFKISPITKANNLIYNRVSNQTNACCLIAFLVILLFSVIILFPIKFPPCYKYRLTFCIFSIIVLIFDLISSFLNVYYLFSISPLLFYIVFVVVNFKKIFTSKSKKIETHESEVVYEIKL